MLVQKYHAIFRHQLSLKTKAYVKERFNPALCALYQISHSLQDLYYFCKK